MATIIHFIFEIIVITELNGVLLSEIPDKLRLLATLPLTKDLWTSWSTVQEGRLCNLAIQKALEDINEFPDLLVGYNLTYDYVDTPSCSSGDNDIILEDAQRKYKFPYVLIGGDCSITTEYILKNLKPYGSPIQPIRDMVKKLKVTKVDVITKNFISDGVTTVLQQLKVLKHLDTRIIVVSAEQSTFMEIMCNAYKLDIYGKHFVWIFTDPISIEFWKDGDVNCTFEEMQKALEGVFFMMPRYHVSFEEMNIANITYSDLVADIFYRANVSNTESYESIHFKYAVGKCYDHVWVAALALNCSVYSQEAIMAMTHEDEFIHYGNRMAACIDMLDFVGTTGRIRFEEGALNPNIVIYRIQDANITEVAYYRQGNDQNSRYEWINGGPIWKDDIIPVDSTPTMQKEKFIPISLYLTMCVLSGVGIMVTIACFVFNVIWRKHRIVKMSSPNTNNIILAGCLLLYVTVVIKTTETTVKAMCAVRIFCFWIGFASAFGSMLSKTWRVHKIFNNKKMKRKMFISDKHLLVIIGIVVTVETALLIIWESFSPHRVIEQKLKTENVTTDSGDKAVIVSFYRVCVSEHSSYFIWTLQIMNGALIFIGVILAWETRHVHIDALNDSKTIGICLYNVLILSAVDMLLSLMLGDKPVEQIGVNSVCLFAGTLASEMLIFLPKILAVYRYPIATPPTAVNNVECLTTSSIHSPEQENTI